MKEQFENTILLNTFWDITITSSIFEILMPDGSYKMWMWDNNHKLIDKFTWFLK